MKKRICCGLLQHKSAAHPGHGTRKVGVVSIERLSEHMGQNFKNLEDFV